MVIVAVLFLMSAVVHSLGEAIVTVDVGAAKGAKSAVDKTPYVAFIFRKSGLINENN